jgi:hypothetical protein
MVLPELAAGVGGEGFLWRLEEVLVRDMGEAGLVGFGWGAAGAAAGEAPLGARETLRRYVLLKAAQLLDEEVRRHAAQMRERGAALRSWMVVYTGGPGGAGRRGLLRLPAYSEVHARYLLLLDCTQPPWAPATPPPRQLLRVPPWAPATPPPRQLLQPRRAPCPGPPCPADYYLSLEAVLEELAQDEETGAADLVGVAARFSAADLGAYELLPCDDVDLCAECAAPRVKRQGARRG